MAAPLIELYIETGTLAGQIRSMQPGQTELILGRNDPSGQSPPVDLSFEDVDIGHSMLVSRRHLCLRVSHRGVSVMDMGSVNGTSVDDRPICPHTEVMITMGARIQLAPPAGPTLLVRQRQFRDADDPVSAEVELWQERYKSLEGDYQQLREAHTRVLSAMQAQGHGANLPKESTIDWSRCQAKILDSLERLTSAYQLLVDAPVEPSARGHVQRAISNLNDLLSLLTLESKQ